MYTINPTADVAQVNGSSISSTSTKYKGGTGLGLGNISKSAMTNELALGNTSTVYGSQVVVGDHKWSAYTNNYISITSVANNSGFARYTKNSHGLTAGTYIMVKDAGAYGPGSVDGVQKITAVTTDTFDTNQPYFAAAGALSYNTVKGNYAKMVARNYVIRGGITNNLANTGTTLVGFGADYGARQSIHRRLHYRTCKTATAIRAGYWNIYTGKFTTLPSNVDNIGDVGNDNEALVTRVAPGDLVYRISGQQDDSHGVKNDQYKSKTE